MCVHVCEGVSVCVCACVCVCVCGSITAEPLFKTRLKADQQWSYTRGSPGSGSFPGSGLEKGVIRMAFNKGPPV